MPSLADVRSRSQRCPCRRNYRRKSWTGVLTWSPDVPMWSSRTSQLTSSPSRSRSSVIRRPLILLPATPKIYQLNMTQNSQSTTPTKHEFGPHIYDLFQPSEGNLGGLLVLCLQFQLPGAHASQAVHSTTLCHDFYTHERMSLGSLCLIWTHGHF